MMKVDPEKIKDPLMRVVYEVINQWLQNKLPTPDQTAFNFTPKTSALFYELLRRIKTMYEDRGFNLYSMVHHVTFEAMVGIAWGEREGTLQPHQSMGLATQLIEITQAAITDAFLFTFLLEELALKQDAAWAVLQQFREYRDKLPNMRTPQPMPVEKRDEVKETEHVWECGCKTWQQGDTLTLVPCADPACDVQQGIHEVAKEQNKKLVVIREGEAEEGEVIQ